MNLSGTPVTLSVIKVRLINSVELFLRYGDLNVFKLGPGRHLDFEKFVFLSADKVRKLNMRHHAKCRAIGQFVTEVWQFNDF